MKILVTGGTGYIGSHTAVELLSAGHEIEIIDNLSNSSPEVIDKIAEITGVRPVFHDLDLLNFPALYSLLKRSNYDLVIHFAGLKAVGESVEHPLKYYETNLVSTINLLKAMQAASTNKIIFSSSATVYGDQGVEKFSETMQTGIQISNPYGKTKYMIEEILKDITAANPDFSAVILRYFNPIGAHPSGLIGESPNDKPNNLMPIIMKVSTGEIPELSIYGDDYDTPDGTCLRDYLHVVDLARGHLAAISQSDTPGLKIYNLGTGRGTSVLEMVRAFEKASGRPLPHQIVSRRPGDLAIICADPSKARKELNWHAELTIDDAMRDTLNFLKSYGKI